MAEPTGRTGAIGSVVHRPELKLLTAVLVLLSATVVVFGDVLLSGDALQANTDER